MWLSKPKPEQKPPFFVWSDAEHSVGVGTFDEEHQRLTLLMARVHEALQADHDRVEARKLMEQLVVETRAHFRREEGAMAAAEYPDLPAHAAEHAALMDRAEELLRQFRNGGVSALVFPSFLRDWLVPHMQAYDRKYAASMRRQGLR